MLSYTSNSDSKVRLALNTTTGKPLNTINVLISYAFMFFIKYK